MMTSFERKFSTFLINFNLRSSSQYVLVTSSPPYFLVNHAWFKLFEDYHDDKTCEVMIVRKKRIFGKKHVPLVNNDSVYSLDWLREDFDIVNTHTKNYNKKFQNNYFNHNNNNFSPKKSTSKNYTKGGVNTNPKLTSTPTKVA